MKSIFLFSAVLCCLNCSLSAQTINPSCYSNAKNWKITKIENAFDGTYVYLTYYGYETGYEFWISPEMYIERYNTYSNRYRVLSFIGNDLNTKYRLDPFTAYTFTLKFERIPDNWTDINIQEPPVQGSNSWHWDYVSLNKPPTERLRMDNFLVNDVIGFLGSFAHPTNTLDSYTYNVDHDAINVTLYYSGGYVTDLKIKFDGKLISNIYVLYDNDWISPFSVMTLIKNWLFKNDGDQTYSSEFERLLNKSILNMSGTDLAAIALTVLWNKN